MSNYNADIQLRVVGKTKLDQLEKQLRRVNKLQTLISKRLTVNINSNVALKQIDKIEARIKKLNKTATVTVREKRTSTSSGRSSSPGNAQSVAAAASLVGSSQVVGSTEKLAGALGKVVAQTELLVNADIRQKQLSDDLLRAGEKKWQAEKEFVTYKEQVLQKQNQINEALRTGEKIGKQSPLQAANSLQATVPKLERLNGELKQAETAFNKVQTAQLNSTKEVVKLGKEQDRLTASTNRTGKAMSGLTQAAIAVGGALAAIGIGRFVVDSFKVATAVASQEIRLKALSDGYDDFAAVQQVVQKSQALFNQTQQEANDLFGKAYARLRPLGLSLEQVRAVYEGFNVAARISGTSAAEAAGSFRQLTQALGSGVLRGEELNSILEQAPALSKAIATELGVTIGQLKAFGKDGAISAETVLKALVRVRNEGINRLSAAMNTPAEKFKKLEVAGEQFKIALADEALPAVTEAVGNLAKIIVALEGPIRGIGQLANQTLGSILDLINAATQPKVAAARAAIEGGRLPLAGLGGYSGAQQLFKGTGSKGYEGLDGLKKESEELAKLRNQPRTTVLLELMENRLGAMDDAKKVAAEILKVETDLSGLLGDLDLGGGGSGSGSGSGTSAADQLQRQLEAGQELSREFREQTELLKTRGEFDKQLLQNQYDYLRNLREINNAAPSQQSGLEAQAKGLLDATNMQTLEEAAKSFGTEMGELASKWLPEVNEELTKTEQLMNSAYEIISDNLASGIEGLIRGTKDLNEIVSDVLGQIGQMLIRSSLNGLGAGMGIPGFANGGRPPLNQVSVVGERGPELFVPDTAGTVISNERSQSVLNTYSAGNSTAIGAPVATSFKLETQVINGVEYATVDQVRQMGAAATQRGAKQGRAQTLATLKNSRSQRSRLGM